MTDEPSTTTSGSEVPPLFFVAPPVRNSTVAPSVLVSMKQLGATERTLAVVRGEAPRH